MISIPDIELIDNVIKWNTTEKIETELVIENPKEENYSTTNNIYHIIAQLDETEVPNVKTFCNHRTNNTVYNFTELSDICDEVTEYDSFEISVVIVLCLLIVVTVIGYYFQYIFLYLPTK